MDVHAKNQYGQTAFFEAAAVDGIEEGERERGRGSEGKIIVT